MLDEMPQLDAWIGDYATLGYVRQMLPIYPGVLPTEEIAREELSDLIAQVWVKRNTREWASFLGSGLVGAAAEGNTAAVQQLIAAGATLNVRDREGCTALHRASYGGHVDIVEQLLDEETNRTGLPIALDRLMWQPNPNGRNPQQLVTASSLMRRGRGVDIRDNVGCLPLHRAAACGNPHIIRMLLACGADPAERDSHQQTPLHHAAIGNDAESIILIVQAGGKPFE